MRENERERDKDKEREGGREGQIKAKKKEI